MDTQTSFGAWLRNRRRCLDLTQEEVADRVGCSVATIRKIESDLRRPSRQIATILAGVLAIEANERPLFLQVARQERLPERLAAIPLPVPRPSQLPAAPLPAQIDPLPLPSPPTPLVGRETELAHLRHLLALPECRLVTLAGPGGSGKTRLALSAAADLQEAFANGVVFVGLASLSAAASLVPAMAKALGFRFTGPREPEAQLLNYLQRKEVLILLDNMEHLLDGVDLLAELLDWAPAVKLLVTSRERLNLQGEWVFDLQGLPIPPPSHRIAGEEELTAYSSVALFVLCARRVQAGFVLSKSNQAHVAQVCRLAGGMPLGIELAAAWVHILHCAEIAQEIEQNLDFLAVARRDLPVRQRSLRATFDHSWKLLTGAEQQVLSRFSVFSGGFDREAAHTVAEASLPLLSSLVTKSLVRRVEQGRYDLHELTRQYAASRLHEDEGLERMAQDAHGQYYLTLVAQHETSLQSGRQGEALIQLDSEFDNVHQAWRRAVAAGPVELAGKAVNGLALYYLWRGRYQEGEAACRLASETLAAGDIERCCVLVNLLTWQGIFCHRLGQKARASLLFQQGQGWIERLTGQGHERVKALLMLGLGQLALDTDRTAATSLVQQSLALYQAVGDEWGMANAYRELGEIARQLGNFAEAKQMTATSLRLHQARQDSRGIADALFVLNAIAVEQGEYAEAEELARQRIELYQQIGDRAGLAQAYKILADSYSYHGDQVQCVVWYEQSLALFTDLGDRRAMSVVLVGRGVPEGVQGRYAAASVYGQRSLACAQEIDYLWGIANARTLLGWAALGVEDYLEARQHLQISIDIFHQLGQRRDISQALTWLGYAELGLGELDQARRALVDSLRILIKLKSLILAQVTLPAFALLLAAQGKPVRAVELHALVTRYPVVATSELMQDLAGKQIAGVAASLPPELTQTAQERGRAGDLAATIAELIAEFGSIPG